MSAIARELRDCLDRFDRAALMNGHALTDRHAGERDRLRLRWVTAALETGVGIPSPSTTQKLVSEAVANLGTRTRDYATVSKRA